MAALAHPCASRHLHIPVQWPLRIEMKSLNSNKLSKIDFFIGCMTPHSFGGGPHPSHDCSTAGICGTAVNSFDHEAYGLGTAVGLLGSDLGETEALVKSQRSRVGGNQVDLAAK